MGLVKIQESRCNDKGVRIVDTQTSICTIQYSQLTWNVNIDTAVRIINDYTFSGNSGPSLPTLSSSVSEEVFHCTPYHLINVFVVPHFVD